MDKKLWFLAAGVATLSILCFVFIIILSFKSSQNLQSNNPPKKPDSNQNNLANAALIAQIVDSQLNEEPQIVETSSSAQTIDQDQVQGTTTTGASYSVLTFDLGSTTIVTDTAGDDDCSNNCPTKSLSQYISDNGGRAGMNGTYFCPPDYSWCSGKVNSYDFPVWNNRNKKWMQAEKLFWGGRGMFVFRPGSAQFFANAAGSGAPSNITGGIVNYPSLLAGGQVVLNEGSLSDNLKVTKGTRSGIGSGGGKLFLVVARRANMGDLVKIFQSLGATDALNLDGGGSVALWQGKYKVGPGRSLPNAIIVK